MGYSKLKYITLCIFLFSILCQTGCRHKQEVFYNTENDYSSTEEVVNAGSIVSLQDSLGIEDLYWEETIPTATDEVKIKTTVQLPDTNAMYTMIAAKASLPNESKKR